MLQEHLTGDGLSNVKNKAAINYVTVSLDAVHKGQQGHEHSYVKHISVFSIGPQVPPLKPKQTSACLWWASLDSIAYSLYLIVEDGTSFWASLGDGFTSLNSWIVTFSWSFSNVVGVFKSKILCHETLQLKSLQSLSYQSKSLLNTIYNNSVIDIFTDTTSKKDVHFHRCFSIEKHWIKTAEHLLLSGNCLVCFDEGFFSRAWWSLNTFLVRLPKDIQPTSLMLLLFDPRHPWSCPPCSIRAVETCNYPQTSFAASTKGISPMNTQIPW